MNDEQRNINKNLETKITSLQNQFNDSEKVNSQLQSQLNDSNKLINEQQNKMLELETSLQKHFSESDKINEQLKYQINYSKNLEDQISQLQSKLTCSEKEIFNINKQLNEFFLIKGQIVSSVENGIIINSEINLKARGSQLDTSKSKVIVSTSDAVSLGSEAYKKGEPITSLQMKTSFVCKPGTYYVRCIVFNIDGKSNEIVSNPVTTSGNVLTFDYKGEPSEISLPQGQYKLEVWGAKGGD